MDKAALKAYEATHLDLFSGIGGFALAAQWAGFRTIGFCEIDKYCQKVLVKNFGAVLADPTGSRCSEARKHNGRLSSLPARLGECSRIYSDIFALDGTQFAGVDLITGGFPCQPFSVAGKRRGKEDDRYLWPQMLRVITEARPNWIVAENVPGFLSMEQFDVLLEMEADGSAKGECGDLVHRVGRGIADEAVELLNRSVTMSNRLLFRLVPSMPSTEENESGLWVSPSAQDGRRGNQPARPWDTGIPLSQQIVMLPTPKAQSANQPAIHGTGGMDLQTTVCGRTNKSGSLNPQFVEWLMGFPIGWTDLKDSATPSSRKSRTKSCAKSES